jgi:hypothetical protein
MMARLISEVSPDPVDSQLPEEPLGHVLSQLIDSPFNRTSV